MARSEVKEADGSDVIGEVSDDLAVLRWGTSGWAR